MCSIAHNGSKYVIDSPCHIYTHCHSCISWFTLVDWRLTVSHNVATWFRQSWQFPWRLYTYRYPCRIQVDGLTSLPVDEDNRHRLMISKVANKPKDLYFHESFGVERKSFQLKQVDASRNPVRRAADSRPSTAARFLFNEAKDDQFRWSYPCGSSLFFPSVNWTFRRRLADCLKSGRLGWISNSLRRSGKGATSQARHFKQRRKQYGVLHSVRSGYWSDS